MKNCATFRTTFLTFCCWMLLCSSSALQGASWDGSIAGSYANTRQDGQSADTYDQRYRLLFTSARSANLRYTASLFYRMIQSSTSADLQSRTEELQPGIDGVWTTPAFKLSGNYQYRDYVGGTGTDLESQQAGGEFATTIANTPLFYGRYRWLQNENNLELLGKDTRQQTITGGMNYSLRRFGVQYDYSERRTLNRSTGFEQTSKQHRGVVNSFFDLISNATLSANYQLDYRSDEEQTGTIGESFLLIPAIRGLYAVDASPQFDELGGAAELADNNLITPVQPPIDLSGNDYHNLGLDFGTAAELDRIHLYTDTLANPTLTWAIYISDDNLNWTLHREAEAEFYNDALLRYELQFVSVNTRYLKVVLEPQPDVTPVLVTELRGLRSREDQRQAATSTDHRGFLDLRYRPVKWLNAGAGANVYRRDESLLQPGRDESAFNGLLRIQPVGHSTLTGQYFFDRAKNTGVESTQTDRERLVGTLDTDWDRTFSTNLSFSRSYEYINSRQTRRSDAAQLRSQMKLLPELQLSVDLGATEDVRFQSNDEYDSKTLSAGLNSSPIDGTTLLLRGTWFELESKSGLGTPYRRTFSSDLNYRITDRIVARGNATMSDERATNSNSITSSLSWSATRKWTFVGGYRHTKTEALTTYRTTLYSLQSTCTLSRATRISGSWSHSEAGTNELTELTGIRVSFETRF